MGKIYLYHILPPIREPEQSNSPGFEVNIIPGLIKKFPKNGTGSVNEFHNIEQMIAPDHCK